MTHEHTGMDRTYYGSTILIHTFELKLWHFEVSPMFVQGSRAFASFPPTCYVGYSRI